MGDNPSSRSPSTQRVRCEEVVCDNCGSAEADLLYEVRDRRYGIGGVFPLVQCRQCGLLYLNPRPAPDSLTTYYPEQYAPYRAPSDSQDARVVRWLERYGPLRRCRAILAWKKAGRVLDVGCSTGVFLAEMARHGHWELHGVEVNARAAEYARQRYGLRIFTGQLAEAGYADEYFDVVTLWHVLEHLPHPRSALSEIHRILKPGGLLVVQVPNLGSWEARLFGRFWAGLDAPRHLFVFGEDTLSSLLQSTGFYQAEAFCLAGGHHSFMISLSFLVDEMIRNSKVSQMVKACIHSDPLRVLVYPYFHLVRKMGKGPSFTVFAKKT
jgi:2-polyprenyl-3-methyl-5-hydroxy-6-metoxy-1,4-benzoquinol methylase